ncbi:uncharacterized protein LOC109839902 [Asparagus officinalis]|nr:uncharacterized protein LOC109839902 [Asparagus officinalis]
MTESSFNQDPGIASGADGKVSSGRSLGFLMSSDQPKKAKGSNLIAKLMGLEELPSESSKFTRKEQKVNECLVQPRPLLPVELSNTRKPPSIEKKTEARTESVKGVVEIVKSDELLKGNEVKGRRRTSSSGHHFDNGFQINAVVRSPQLPPQSDDALVSVKTRAINLNPEEIACNNGDMLSREFERKEGKNAKRNNVTSYLQTENVASSEIDDAGPKLQVHGRKAGNKESKTSATPKSRATLISRSPAKSDNRRIIKNVPPNNQAIACKGGNASRKHNQTLTRKPTSQHFTNLAKVKKSGEAKPVTKSMDIKAFTCNVKCKDVKVTNKSRNLPADAPAKKAKKNSIPYNRGCKKKDTKLFNEVMVNSGKCERTSKPPEESIEAPNSKAIIQTKAKVEECDIQLLLLNTQSFISHAYKLFGFDDHQTTNQQTKGTFKLGTENADLLLDCAKELMARKRRQQAMANHYHMLRSSLWNLAVVSLDQLVNEISYGIEKLIDHRKNGAGVGLKDSVYVILERDLRCKDITVNTNWDMGWLNFICVEEADHIVGQVEDLILYGLVEELFC